MTIALKYLTASTLAIAAALHAFDNTIGWKKDADGKLAVDANGNPIYVDSDNREMSVEGTTISRLNGEAATNRKAKETLEAQIAKYKDLDPDAARKAIETVGKIDAKKLIDAGEVDKVREQISSTFTAQLTERDQKLSTLQGKLDNAIKSSAFKSSKFIQERVAVPAEMFEATFGGQFKVENEKVVPYGRDGNPIYSSKRAGEIADLDEALEKIVEGYPYKDAILKAVDHSGTDNNGQGGYRGGNRTIKRSEFEKLPPNKAHETAIAMGKGEITVVD